MFALNTRLIQKELQKQDNRKGSLFPDCWCVSSTPVHFCFHDSVQELLKQDQIRNRLQRVGDHQARLKEVFQHFWTTSITQRDKLERLAAAIRTIMGEISVAMVSAALRVCVSRYLIC